MATISKTRTAKKRALSPLGDQNIVLGEPYDGDNDEDFLGDKIGGNGGRHKKQKPQTDMKQQQQQQEEKPPGWWPDRYAPENPESPSMISRMNAVIKKCNKAGYSLEDLWKDDGLMVQAILKGGRHRLTQRTFDRIDYPVVFKQSKKGVATAGYELQRNSSNAIESDSQYLATDAPALSLPDRDDSDESPPSSNHSNSGAHNDELLTSPNRAVSVDSDKSFPAPPTPPPASETISRLRGSDWLKDIDILRCVELLNASPEWHISIRDIPRRRPNWLLKHYNSLLSEMPVNDLKSWILEQPAIRLTGELSIREEKCPQQRDGFNCGIFTLAVLQALLNGNSIPSEVDANHLRSLFAGQLESTTSSELAQPSSEAVSPGMPPRSRRASFEQSHSDAHNLGLLDDPGEHGVAFPPLSHLQEFAKSLEKTEVNLREDIKALEKQKEQLAKMSQERYLFQQKLANSQKLADELTGKVEKSEADYKAACECLSQWITGCKVEPANTLLNKIISDAKSTIQSSAAEINSHKEILESMQAKCDEYKDTIEKLQAEILSSTKQGDVIEKNIRRNRESLTHVNQEFAKIAVSLGFTEW
ncbi:uncharacterized protein BKA55DRAFT_544477 [Fusarium redolens]|uniref:Ubiquitin-like protease family profile domain-containing protein n=1 Tax=Fusarium redolens TaxID=48865 RepID=A0A9P9G6P4_FUSRE|nr:uncharacterized protein BKA55DRAFT_544477 [Fusarium redolens]KAH7234019.1 hypothetical protein BKA55DRAFT_544477 [Fusarium redolens]